MEKYVFKPYKKIFPKLFNKEKQRIITGVKDKVIIEQIGSTAIPGLGGKGIIDIAIAANKKDLADVSGQLQQLGYRFSTRASTPDRLFFEIDLPDPEEKIRRYHIHLTYPESMDWKQMTEFRDYLRSHLEEAGKYAEVKKDAVRKAGGDGAKYRKMKEPAIKDILNNILKEQKIS